MHVPPNDFVYHLSSAKIFVRLLGYDQKQTRGIFEKNVLVRIKPSLRYVEHILPECAVDTFLVSPQRHVKQLLL